MNKIVASVGLVALGASSISAVAQDLGAPVSKPWNVAASLRGFYDDNINATHDQKIDSFGVQIAPEIGYKWSGPATTIGASYRYTMNYYDEKPAGDSSNFDSTHMFTGFLNHQFNERYQIGVSDSFVIGEEPDSLRVPNSPLATNQKIPGDNIRNYGAIIFTAQFTPVFGVEAGYANTFVDYHGTFNNGLNAPPLSGSTNTLPVVASPSGALDRIDHAAHLDARWTIKPTTVFLIGYMYDQTVYTGDEVIAGTITNTAPTIFDPPNRVILDPLTSSQRDSRSHIGYVGAEHLFRPDFKGSLRVGIQYTSFYNDPQNSTQTSPYLSGNLNYTYAPESYFNLGLSVQQSATDVTGSSASDFVKNSDTVGLYGTVRHRIVPKLFGTLLFTFQNSTFNGGSLDGDSEQYYQFGANLEYKFNPYISTEVGYNYDRTSSEIVSREYDRNRVYIGVTGNY